MLIKKEKEVKLHDYKLIHNGNKVITSAFFYLKKKWWYVSIVENTYDFEVEAFFHYASKTLDGRLNIGNICWNYHHNKRTLINEKENLITRASKQGIQIAIKKFKCIHVQS